MSPQSYFLKKTYPCELPPSPLPAAASQCGEGGLKGFGGRAAKPPAPQTPYSPPLSRRRRRGGEGRGQGVG